MTYQQPGPYGQPNPPYSYPPQPPRRSNTGLIVIIVLVIVAVIGGVLAIVLSTTGGSKSVATSNDPLKDPGIVSLSDVYITQGINGKSTSAIMAMTCSADQSRLTTLLANAPFMSASASITAKATAAQLNGDSGTLTYHAEGTIGGQNISQDLNLDLIKEANQFSGGAKEWVVCNTSLRSFPTPIVGGGTPTS